MANDKPENHNAHRSTDVPTPRETDTQGRNEGNLAAARQFSMDDLKTAVGASARSAADAASDVLKQTNFSIDDLKKVAEGKDNNDLRPKDKFNPDDLKQKDNTGKLDSNIAKNKLPNDIADKLSSINDKQNNDLRDIIEKYKTTEKMNDKIDPKMSEQDQKTARELNSAIASGDSQAAARALERFKGDPEGLKKFMDQYNKVLKESGSGVVARTDGEKVTFSDGSGRGVEVGTDGSASVRQTTHHRSGIITNGRYLHDENPGKAFDTMGQGARFQIKFGEIIRTLEKTPSLEKPMNYR